MGYVYLFLLSLSPSVSLSTAGTLHGSSASRRKNARPPSRCSNSNCTSGVYICLSFCISCQRWVFSYQWHHSLSICAHARPFTSVQHAVGVYLRDFSVPAATCSSFVAVCTIMLQLFTAVFVSDCPPVAATESLRVIQVMLLSCRLSTCSCY